MDIFSLISGFGNFFWVVIAFVVALSVIVAIHEYGHYIVGRWCGIGADVFSIGFGPVLWSRFDKRGTKWQIAAFPLGGYVKFKGDANAASGKDGDAMAAMNEDELRHTMHGAPLWARTATVAAGPVFNFILSTLVFAAVFMVNGQPSEKFVVGELSDLPVPAYEMSIGDEIVAIEGQSIETPEQRMEVELAVRDTVPTDPIVSYDVLRDGAPRTVTGPYLFPPLVSFVAPRSAAYAAGLEPGDVITAVDGAPILAFSQLKEIVETGEGNALLLSVWRFGEEIEFTMVPRRVDEPQPEGGFKTHWRIGIQSGPAIAAQSEPLPVGLALWGGVVRTGDIVSGSISGLYHMIAGKISSCNLSGPVGIAQVSGAMASQGLMEFVFLIGVLSAAIGMLNLFPIPMLDGGHLVFYAYEAVAGKPPSDAALRILMSIGLFIVLSLMLFGLLNDVIRC